MVEALSPLPTSRVALPVEACNQQDAVGFNFEEKTIGKAPHGCPSSVPVDNGKAQRELGDDLDCGFHRLHEAI